ncbi:MAG: hypothetical protein ACI83O_000434 [Patescibacteria group bacterium]|jgi:hypothetical protein
MLYKEILSYLFMKDNLIYILGGVVLAPAAIAGLAYAVSNDSEIDSLMEAGRRDRSRYSVSEEQATSLEAGSSIGSGKYATQ